ncbi:MAG: DUF5686 and carboxypeptidase regulatory-like domain-containing protein [Bacteroidia bacterium]
MRNILLIVCYVFLIGLPADAASLRGLVTDTSGAPIPYANVYLKNNTQGTSCDASGNYLLNLRAGEHAVVFSAVGYRQHEETVFLAEGQTLVLNVQLEESALNLGEAVVTAAYVDRGKEIMRLARKKSRNDFDAVENYRCQTYQKITVEIKKPEPAEKAEEDTTETAVEDNNKKEEKEEKDEKDEKEKKKKKKEKEPTVMDRARAQLSKIRKMRLIESVEETNYQKPGKYKVITQAWNDFSDVMPAYRGRSVSVGFSYGEPDIAGVGRQYEDPYLITFKPWSADFNFSRNLIHAPLLSQKPLLSPLAATAELSYRFSLDSSFIDSNGKKIYKINVIPLFPGEALFSGFMLVEDSTWMLQEVDFSINPEALMYCRDFRIKQQYAALQSGISMPVSREFIYTIKDGSDLRKGHTLVTHTDYELNTVFPPRFFNNEIQAYDVTAFDKDSAWWKDVRPISLRANEIEYIAETDSSRDYLISDAFLDSLDAEINKLDIWDFLLMGIYHQNHRKGIRYNIDPLVAQLNPFGIGGYRHRLGGGFSKEFENDFLLETRGFVDYGFANKDVKGKLGAGLTYVPLKFVRTYIDVGDNYEVVNNYASLSTLFSRANYVRSRSISVAQRMEIVNGLFGEVTLEYGRMDPLTNMQHDEWSEVLYGDLNEPVDFKSYRKSEVSIQLKYRPGQKYMIKRNKKIITGSDYPEFSLRYRKGINGLFQSEVNFDYLEAGVNHEVQLKRFGFGTWNFLAGTFLNKKSLRVIEYRYFRGSDPYLFSNPLTSFQLLGPTLSASGPFLRLNGIFHDQGYLFNKVPLLNKAHLGLAGGAGFLAIPEQNDFRHGEIFGGLEWIFRIKKQLFRAGFYAVTSENTIALPQLTWKFGFSFYNDYRRKWDY